MSGIVVQNTAVNPGGQPLEYAPVTIALVTGVPTMPGYTAAGDILTTYQTSTDATGHWSATLTPNASITPANTYYQVIEGHLYVSPIVVPASGGPYNLSQILATPPPTPGAPGITGVQVADNGAVAGVRPEINLVAGSNVSLSVTDDSAHNRVDVTISSAGSAGALLATNNLDDVQSASASRANLGLGTAAVAAIDTTTGDLQPIGVAAAGATGKVSDGGHVHPLQPWQFDVKAYGAKGDGIVVHDGAMTSGQSTLACTTSTPFVSGPQGSAGKSVYVRNALASGQSAGVGTVTAVTDTGHATVSFSATQNISSTIVVVATDDTAAFQDAELAANTYAQNNPFGLGSVVIPPGIYGIAGALVTGGSTLGNAQIPIHFPATTANKVTLMFECFEGSTGATGAHWQQQVFQTTGAVLFSFGVFANASAQATSITTSGHPCVIGGPTQPNHYGDSNLTFANVNVVLRNIAVITPLSASGWNYCGVDLSGCAQATIRDVLIGVGGTYAANDFISPNSFSAGLSKALLMPAAGNNDLCVIDNLSIWGGYTWAALFTEHSVIHNARLLYCWSAAGFVGAYFNSVGAGHAIEADQLSVEGCTFNWYIFGQAASGIGPQIDVLQMDTESPAPACRDDGNGGVQFSLGRIKLTGLYTPSSINIPMTGLEVIDGQQRPGPVTATAIPTGTTPLQNPHWRWVNITLAGGSVTAVKIGAYMGGVSAPTMTPLYTQSAGALPLSTWRVPPGGWIEVDCTVAPSTNSWVLD